MKIQKNISIQYQIIIKNEFWHIISINREKLVYNQKYVVNYKKMKVDVSYF